MTREKERELEREVRILLQEMDKYGDEDYWLGLSPEPVIVPKVKSRSLNWCAFFSGLRCFFI